MHRFQSPFKKTSSKIILTDSSEIHHLKNVLRLKIGNKVTVFNGQGLQAQGEIQAILKDSCTINIIDITECSGNAIEILLACAIPKKGKFETIIEKATELGVTEIFPLQTKRTEVLLKGERAAKKLTRYETVALNAAKQSQRGDVPLIHPISDLASCFNILKNDSYLIMPGLITPRVAIKELLPLPETTKRVAIFIGPEGDFTQEEYDLARSEGAHIVSLGQTTLKVETAALSAVSFVHLMTS